jgi:hypothetical protein
LIENLADSSFKNASFSLNGEHSVTAKAEIGGQTFVAAASFTVGAAQNQTTPAKTATKKTKK